jgi:hypothetical protein
VLSPWRESRRRRAAWLALILAVLLAHALLGLRVLASVIGWNGAAQPRRIEIAFTRQLQPSAPPAAPAATAPPPPEPRTARAVRSPRASSAPADAASSSRRQLEEEALALADRLAQAQRAAEAEAAAQAEDAAASAAAAASASSAVAAHNVDPVAGPERKPLDWPPSTRLTYTLTGLVRGGNLYGNAVVEWRRDGTHYQVQSDVHVENLFTDRHIFSDGEITAQGLSPRHFDELLELPMVAPRRSQIEFTDSEVLLPNGNRMIKLPQTQDEASQFVQFVWLFTMHPELARPGTLVDFPLALTRSMRRWHYRVAGIEPLEMPFGTLSAIHLVPVPTAPRRPNEYTFEFWMAPTLQYLPVRVVIQGDEHNLADLTLAALPKQAAPAADGAASQAMLR